jgi:hypothetical protein
MSRTPSTVPAGAPESQPKNLHPRAAGSYQYQRQRAMQGKGAAVAEARGSSWHTLESELDKLERCPIAKAAATVRAMRLAGLSPEDCSLYAAELLDELEAASATDPRSEAALHASEQAVDGDEDVVQLRVVRDSNPITRRDHCDQLILDAAFLQPGTGLTGILRHKGQGAATVQLRRFRDVVIRGEVKAHAAEVTTWSLATEVEPLPEQPELAL